MLWSLLTSFSWIYAEESCVWMDAAHVTHSHIDDIVLLKRTPVGLNNVEIKIFNPKEEEYQFLWEADIGDGVFAYNPKWAWVQSIRITNGCTSVRYKIDVNDYNVKINAIKKFIAKGNKVKLVVMLRGREMQHSHLAFELANRVVTDLADFPHSVEKEPALEGKNLLTIFAPAANNNN